MKILLCVLFYLSCSLAAHALVQGTGVGSSPTVAPSEPSQTVKPGETHTNGDSVGVTNDKKSQGDIKVTPKVGTHDSATTVTFKSKAKGEVKDIDCNDIVNVGAKGEATVSGSCGTVNINATSAEVKVTNDGSGGNITVNKPDGTSVEVPPGGSTTYP